MLTRLAGLPRSPATAYGFVTLIAALASLISWGIGLIVGGIMALEVARVARQRGIRLHYPLLVASAYSGFVVWHMGYTGSGPLAAATPGSFFGDLAATVPVTQTIFAWWNIVVIVITVPVIVISMMLLTPRDDDSIVELEANQQPTDDADKQPSDESLESTQDTVNPRSDTNVELADAEELRGRGQSITPAERIDASRIVTTSIGMALVVYLIILFAREGFALTLNTVNWSFLAIVLLLVHSPQQLATLITDAGRTVGQLLLQYPLYAGILGMIAGTGLVEVISSFFVDIASPSTLGVITFFFAGLTNFFVPSGGGQFAIQAPIFINAADQLGVSHEVIIMAIAYGDQWTNMVQPFFAVLLLSVAGLKIRDILGYTTITLLVSGVVFIGALLMLGAG